MIEHRAFIDLEQGLTDRANQAWRATWKPLAADLKRAVKAQDWARAERLVDSLDTDHIAIHCATYAQTIGLSALLLGASRLVPIQDSVIAHDPPVPQLTHGIAQWGFIVSRNLPELLKLKLHKALAQHEHDLEQARHTITKFDVNEARDAHGRWFEGSKIVDAQGKPLTLYHGTPKPTFTNFDATKVGSTTDEGWLGSGFYFYDRGDFASLYAGTTGAVYPVHVVMKNPFEVTFTKENSRVMDREIWIRQLAGVSKDASAQQVTDKLKSRGYDGVIYTDEFGSKEYVAYEPTQIKSAVGNRGTFDRKNPDITKEDKFTSARFTGSSVRKESEMEEELPEQETLATDESVAETSVATLDDLFDAVAAQGTDVLSTAASLMVSRLSSFGFLVEAQEQGIERYEISAVLDEHTCPVCEVMDGQIFDVTDGVAHAAAIMDAEDPDSLRSLAPWPSQSKASVADLADSDTQDLVDSGLALPPYHPQCRCLATAVDVERPDSVDEGASAEQAESAAEDADLPSVSMATISALLGVIGDLGEIDRPNIKINLLGDEVATGELSEATEAAQAQAEHDKALEEAEIDGESEDPDIQDELDEDAEDEDTDDPDHKKPVPS